jgi:hypothetical protein
MGRSLGRGLLTPRILRVVKRRMPCASGVWPVAIVVQMTGDSAGRIVLSGPQMPRSRRARRLGSSPRFISASRNVQSAPSRPNSRSLWPERCTDVRGCERSSVEGEADDGRAGQEATTKAATTRMPTSRAMPLRLRGSAATATIPPTLARNRSGLTHRSGDGACMAKSCWIGRTLARARVPSTHRAARPRRTLDSTGRRNRRASATATTLDPVATTT